MRRSEREFTDMQEIETLLSKVWVCRLALHNEPFPYIVPLNFGYVRDGERLTMYFHCAHEGTKIDLLRKNPHASFEVEGECAVVGRENACSFTAHYESVIGEGILSIAQGEEKAVGLRAVMGQIAPGRGFTFPEEALKGVTVLRLDVQSVRGKRNPPQ